MTMVSDLMHELDSEAVSVELPPDDPMAPNDDAPPPPPPVQIEEAEPFTPEGVGILDRIKGFAKVRKDDPNEKPSTSRARAKNLSALETIEPEDLSKIILVPLIGLAMLAVPKHLRANDIEIAAATEPLARIMLRHIKPLRKVGPDFLDCAMLLGITVGYMRRINQERDYRENPNQIPVNQNGGVGSNAPQPPQQMEAKQDGRSNVLPIRNGDPVSEYLGGISG